MVYITKPTIVAALVIAPALAAPVSQVTEEQTTREFNEEESFVSRDFQESSDLVERAGGKLWGTAAAAVAAGLAARPLGESLATIFKRPKNPQFARDFEGEDLAERDFSEDADLVERGAMWNTAAAAVAAGLAARPLGESLATIFKRPKNPQFARDFDDEELLERDFDDEELFERELEDLLEERTPVQAQTLLKVGTSIGKHAKWMIPAGGLAGMGIGLAGKLRSRELSMDDELFQRELEDALEERSPVQAQSLLKLGVSLGKHAKWMIPAGGLAGMGIGLAGKLRSREFDDALDMYERDFERSLNELD